MRNRRAIRRAIWFRTVATAGCLAWTLMHLTGCMSDKEYQLRSKQLSHQANHQQVYSPWEAEGPVTISVADGGKVRVQAQTQPYSPIPIPDGQAYQTGLVKTALGIGAATAIGIKAMDKGDTTIHNHAPKEVTP